MLFSHSNLIAEIGKFEAARLKRRKDNTLPEVVEGKKVSHVKGTLYRPLPLLLIDWDPEEEFWAAEGPPHLTEAFALAVRIHQYAHREYHKRYPAWGNRLRVTGKRHLNPQQRVWVQATIDQRVHVLVREAYNHTDYEMIYARPLSPVMASPLWAPISATDKGTMAREPLLIISLRDPLGSPQVETSEWEVEDAVERADEYAAVDESVDSSSSAGHAIDKVRERLRSTPQWEKKDATMDMARAASTSSTYTWKRKTEWGEMRVKEGPFLVQHAAPLGKSKRWKPTTMGVLSSIHRMTTDGNMWQVKKKRQRGGGAVLVDTSGSMSWDKEDLQRLLEALPFATVAVYAGVNTDAGITHIVAKNGKRMDRVPKVGGYNVIDGPALDWLAGQDEPRIWISDGFVTGVGEEQTANLLVDVAEKMEASSIVRFKPDQLWKLIEHLKKEGLIKENEK